MIYWLHAVEPASKGGYSLNWQIKLSLFWSLKGRNLVLQASPLDHFWAIRHTLMSLRSTYACVCVFLGFPATFLSYTYSSSPYVLLASSVSLFWCGKHNVIWWRVEEIYLNSLIMDFFHLSSYLSLLFGPVTSLTACPQTPSLYALRFQEERPLFTSTYNKGCNCGFPTVNASISFLLLPYGRVRPCLWNWDLCRTHWPSPG